MTLKQNTAHDSVGLRPHYNNFGTTAYGAGNLQKGSPCRHGRIDLIEFCNFHGGYHSRITNLRSENEGYNCLTHDHHAGGAGLSVTHTAGKPRC